MNLNQPSKEEKEKEIETLANTALDLGKKYSRLYETVLTQNVENQNGVKTINQMPMLNTDMRESNTNDSPRTITYNDIRSAWLNEYNWRAIVNLLPAKTADTRVIALAIGRQIDQVIINAMAQKAGIGKESFDFDAENQTIKTQGGLIQNIREAGDKFLMNEAHGPLNEWHIALTKYQMLELRKKVAGDYNTEKALLSGSTDTFLGFHFHILPSEWFPKSEDKRTIYAWTKSGLCLGIGDCNPDNYSELGNHYFSIWIELGAVRLEETKVVAIECDEKS